MFIKKHEDLQKGITITSLGVTNWFYTFIDLSAGVTNLTCLPRITRLSRC